MTTLGKMIDQSVLDGLVAGRYAFVDAGSGDGNSIDHCERRFGRRPGLGLDYHKPDVEIAVSRGFDVHWCNIVAEPLPRKSASTMCR